MSERHVLYLLRHGQAGERETWAGDDRERPLTQAGRREMHAVAQGLRWLNLKLDALITSPLTRAHATADCVAQALHPPLYTASDLLAPGCDMLALGKVLEQYPQMQRIMLVGHEPDLSQMIGELICAETPAQVAMKKAACCRINLDSEAITNGTLAGRGVLIWHLPPKLLLRLGR